MDNILEILQNLAGQTGFANLTWGNYLMIAVALVFLYLAIARGYEPLLLVPISFGMLLVNMYPPIMEEGGLLHFFFLLDGGQVIAEGTPAHCQAQIEKIFGVQLELSADGKHYHYKF